MIMISCLFGNEFWKLQHESIASDKSSLVTLFLLQISLFCNDKAYFCFQT